MSRFCQVYLKVCNKESYIDTVEIFTQEMHRFHVWKSPLGGIGKKEGIEESDYWNLLKNEFIRCAWEIEKYMQ